MHYIDLILKASAVLTALGVIIGIAIKFFKGVNKIIEKIDSFNARMDGVEKHSEENYMSLLRLIIMSNEMPIGERINAGYKYLDNDGNGEIKVYLKEKFNITKTVDEAPHYKK